MSKQQFHDMREHEEQIPKDYSEYSEPITEGVRWEMLETLERCQIENKHIDRDIRSRIANCQYASEAYDIKKEMYSYIDNSSDMRQKAIKNRVNNSVNRKNT